MQLAQANADIVAQQIASLGELEPDNFPVVLGRALRRELFEVADSHALIRLGRKVSQHGRDDYDIRYLLPALAYAAHLSFSQARTEIQVLEGVEKAIDELAWAMVSSPNGLNSPVLQAVDGNTVAAVEAAIDAQIAEDVRARDLSTGDADVCSAKIREMVKDADARFPQLGLSFGYIGNIWYGPYHDDRSFRVFTKLATPACSGGCDVRFGEWRSDRLGDMLIAMEKRFEEWLTSTQALLDAGRLRRVGA